MQNPNTSETIQSIRDYIISRTQKQLNQLTNETQLSFYDYLDMMDTDLISAYPGSGKTREATRFANEIWEQWNLPTLYLMLSHQMIEERIVSMKEYGSQVNWSHWRSHGEACSRSDFNLNGYIGHGTCTCSRPPIDSKTPTLAPIEYVLPAKPSDGMALTSKAYDFFMWIFDEIDFRRLLGNVAITRDDVEQIGNTHPDVSIRAICQALVPLMNSSQGFRLNGQELYSALIDTLKTTWPKYEDLQSDLINLTPTMQPWLDTNERLPKNFPPLLIPLFLQELGYCIRDTTFSPRIHLVGTGIDSELRLWWRKNLEEADGPYAAPSIILDATADPDLLKLVFPISAHASKELPEWPTNVIVHQWSDDLVSRGTLGMDFRIDPTSPRSIATRNRWYSRVIKALAEIPREYPVGIITHMDIEEECRNAIQEAGFADVRSLHYGDERGSNILEDVQALILLGLPIPNTEGFKEEAQAFLYDQGVLDFNWTVQEKSLKMRDGTTPAVKVGGYWSGIVARYYKQKCQSGLYQALHRIRPYIDRDYQRHIFIFTNSPIDGVLVDELLRDEEVLRIQDRVNTASDALVEMLSAQESVTVPELSYRIGIQGENIRSLQRWINENGLLLAERSGSLFTPGKTRRPGLFASPTLYI